MTHEDVMQMLAETEIPFAYDHFAEGESPDPPFICFFYGPSDDLYADNENYQDIRKLNIELYTTYKDFALEKTIENILKLNGLSFYREENFIESEQIWQIAYEMEVVING